MRAGDLVLALVVLATTTTLYLAHHVDHPCTADQPIWRPERSIDVEYATAGIFDCAHYYDSNVVPVTVDPPREGEHPWYDLCLTRAHGPPGSYDDAGAGIVPFGCVSSSGRGDGSYVCHIARLANATVVAVCVTFVPDDAETSREHARDP